MKRSVILVEYSLLRGIFQIYICNSSAIQITNTSSIIIIIKRRGPMQIVSEAFFEKLREQPILHTSNHHRIAFVTSSELVIRQITLTSKCYSIKLKGTEVIGVSLQNPNFIVILLANGTIQARKVDEPSEIIRTAHVPLAKESCAKLRVSSQCIYILNKNVIDCIYLNRQKGQKKVILEDAKENPLDLLISTIFEEEIILVHYPSSITITAEGKNIAEAPFQTVHTFKLLKNPLLLTESKQFLLIVQEKKTLKVFDIFDLEPILEMQLFIEPHEEIQVKIDPLYEYVMIRIYDPFTKATKRNSLLKINQDFYKGSAKQPFFLFDIEVGLKYDFILFPTHLETIKDTQFYSIDMCFFAPKEIRIATLVVDVNHRSKLHNAKYAHSSWVSHSSWKDFFFNVKQTMPKGARSKAEQLEYNYAANYEDWQVFLQRFYQQNLPKTKFQGLYKVNLRLEQQKYLQCSNHKQSKDIIEYEDALNTLSGSSSFGSLKEIPIKLESKLIRSFQGQYLSSEEEEYKDSRRRHQDKASVQSFDSEESERDEYLKMIEGEVIDSFGPIEENIGKVDQRLDRLEHIHIRKLKNMKHSIKRHQKQTCSIDKNIEKWCEEQFMNFSCQLKDNLKKYSSMIGRYEINQIRYVKKSKKHFRDFLELQLEKCSQRLQQNQKSLLEIERIAKKQEEL